jgi:predicted DNA-binding protein (UPF0251 family)
MSPRIVISRKINSIPSVKGFKPYGDNIPETKKDPVYLTYEEIEAIRLCDYEGYTHLQASSFMAISRPTFTRIYARALQKIATAFVEGREIIIHEGNAYIDSSWYYCPSCRAYFTHPFAGVPVDGCIICHDLHVTSVKPNSDSTEKSDIALGLCICPRCGYEQKHQPGVPCSSQTCPNCQHHLIRKSLKHCANTKKHRR